MKLNAKAMSSPKRVVFLTMKLFGGPGESKASLGELGSRKTKEKTFLPPFFWYFSYS